MKHTLVALAACAAVVTATSAQPDTSLLPIRLFGGVEAGLSLHSGSMRRIGTIPSCCAEFTSGAGFSYALGAGIEVPFSLSVPTFLPLPPHISFPVSIGFGVLGTG